MNDEGTALALLVSLTVLILVTAAHSFFQVKAPRATGLTFGIIGFGIGVWIFVDRVLDGPSSSGLTLLGAFALAGVYSSMAVASFTWRGSGSPPPWAAVSTETAAGIAVGVGGAYLINFARDPGWNAVGVALGTTLGAAAGAAVATRASGHMTYARRDRVITAACTLLLAYCAVTAVSGLPGQGSLRPTLPYAVEHLFQSPPEKPKALPKYSKLPQLHPHSRDYAVKLLRQDGFTATPNQKFECTTHYPSQPDGSVIGQHPDPGTPWPTGNPVTLVRKDGVCPCLHSAGTTRPASGTGLP
jgi:hypothetical protein